MEQVLKLSEIVPYENNARKNDKAVKDVAESIKQCGYIAPIIVDENNVILAGHTRYKALKKLGYKEVAVRKVSGLTDEQKRKYRLLDNKTNELADWDFEKLKDEIDGLDFSAFDIDWGIEEDTEAISVIEDSPIEIDNTHEPITKLGDIYQLGEHRLMCGDSTNKASVEMLINGGKVDLVFTDPPYGMSAVSKSGVLQKNYKQDIMNDDTNKVAVSAFLLSKKMFPNARQIWFGANYYTECLPSSECWIVWDKNNGASDQTDCELAWTNFRSVVRQFTMASEKINRIHPTQKPVKLFSEIINKFEREEKFNYVLDLFGGSGSTLIACEQLNRKCYCMELDPKYCDVIIKRWETFTGKKAIKLK